MKRVIVTYTISFIIFILSVSCSTMKPKNHKSQQAFLEWWLAPHYETAAFSDYKGWEIINNPKEFGLKSDLLKGNENIYHILKWDEYNWYLILSKENNRDAWFVQMPQNTWSLLDTNLSYDLSIDTMKYSDVTEAGINFYWCIDAINPIIEFTTNGPACTSHYLYLWQKDKNIYKFWRKNYD